MAPTLPPPGDEGVLWIVDLSGFVFRAYHASPPRMTSRGEPVHAVAGVVSTLERLVTRHRPAHLAVAIDSKESVRKARFPEYKSNRKERPPDLEGQALRVREVAEALGIPCLEAPGWEADDVIATLVRRAREAALRVVIASGDKDLLQLVGDGVCMWDGMRDRVYGPDETFEKLGVWPAQVRDFLALTGDASDHVPGVPSVGPKTAASLLARFTTFDGVYAALAEVEKKGLREKLTAHRAEADLSRELVTLNEALPLPFELARLRWGGADVPRLTGIFRELEMPWALAALERIGAPASAVQGAPRASNDVAPPTPPAPVSPPAPPPLPAQATLAFDAPPPTRRIEVAPSRPSEPGPRDAIVVSSRETLDATLSAASRTGALAWHTLLDGDDERSAPVVGLALAWEGGAAYVPIGHVVLDRPPQLPARAVGESLARALADETVEGRVHGWKREARVWARLGVTLPRVPSRTHDVELASYLLDAEGHAHAHEDLARAFGLEAPAELPLSGRGKSRQRPSELSVDAVVAATVARATLAYTISPRQSARLDAEGLSPLFRELELPLSGVLLDMERAGVAIDAALLGALANDAATRLAALERACHEAAGHAFSVRSPRALEVVLFDELGLPAQKRTKTARSTDHEVLEELAPLHPLPERVLALRALEKLKGTYLDALPAAADPTDGRVHPRFHQVVAATGRLSSSDPNLQNIPIRTEEGRAIRGAFVAPEGFSILSADYSQIQLRVLAHVSDDPELVRAFVTGADVHIETAKAIFGVEAEDVTRAMRARAKTVNFAVIYGQTEHALARNLKIPIEEAAASIRAFFARYAGVARWLEAVVEEARREGKVRTLLGRLRAVPGLDARGRTERWAAERVARNTPIQGSAADILKRAMVEVARRLEGRRSRMVLTVHDELLVEVAHAEADAVTRDVVEAMEQAMALRVPLVVEHGLGRTWKDAH